MTPERLAGLLAVPVSRGTVRRLRLLPLPQQAVLRVIGVDLSGVLSHPSVTSASVA